MKRLLLLCLTAAVLVSCLGLSAQAAPTLSWTEFYTMGDAASAHTRIDPIELDGTTTLFLPASVSRKAVPVYFTLSEKNAVVTATGSRGSVALKSGDTLDLTALCEGTDDMITLRARSGSMQAEKRVTFLGYDNVSTMFLVSDDPVNEGREWVESSEDKSNRAKGSMALLAADGESVYDGKLTRSIPAQIAALAINVYPLTGTVDAVEEDGRVLVTPADGGEQVVLSLPDGVTMEAGETATFYTNGMATLSIPAQMNAIGVVK